MQSSIFCQLLQPLSVSVGDLKTLDQRSVLIWASLLGVALVVHGKAEL
jgi:hypothetical protein